MIDKIKQKHKEGGFTIIEVMIVLAIAGLIMIVVFLAVPALQRSGRNNALNTSANNILTGVSTFLSNNNGTVPTGISRSGNTVSLTGPSGSNTETINVDSSIIAVSFKGAASPTAITNASAPGTVQLVVGTLAKCNDTASGLAASGGTTRSYVLLYTAETGSGNVLKCIGG